VSHRNPLSSCSPIVLALIVCSLAASPVWARSPRSEAPSFQALSEIFAAKAYQVVDRTLALGEEVAAGELVAVDRVELANGGVREIGERLLPGDAVVRGVLANRGRASLALKLDDGRVLRVGGSDLVVVGDNLPPVSTVPGKSCSVTCGAGYYACCNNNVPDPTCVCYKNGSTNTCDSGGPGSTSCSFGLTLAE